MADLELQPLDSLSKSLVGDLLAGEEFELPSEFQATLNRIVDLGLGEKEYDDDDWFSLGERTPIIKASEMLRSIEARGMLGEILP